MLKKTHEAFRIDRSSCVHLAFIVHLALAFALRSRSAFAHRSPFTYRSPNSVLRSHTVHSACVQRSFIVRSAFAHRSSGKVERFRDCSRSKQFEICLVVLYGPDGKIDKAMVSNLVDCTAQLCIQFSFQVCRNKEVSKHYIHKHYRD